MLGSNETGSTRLGVTEAVAGRVTNGGPGIVTEIESSDCGTAAGSDACAGATPEAPLLPSRSRGRAPSEALMEIRQRRRDVARLEPIARVGVGARDLHQIPDSVQLARQRVGCRQLPRRIDAGLAAVGARQPEQPVVERERALPVAEAPEVGAQSQALVGIA